jgi:octaprenyl-diphosphate synthase
MTNASATTDMAEFSPLQHLAHALENDMRAVNELIIDRMQSDIPLIPQLASYLIASGGKRIRPLLTIAAARLFDANTTRPYRLAASVEFIHTATLLHDDVVDESDQRRGQASANAVFGNQASVLVGDFLFSRAFELMVEDGSIDVLRVLSHASAVIAEGEVLQLSLQNNVETTIDQYNQVIGAKTAALFAAATEVGAIVANQNHKIQSQLRDYGYHLGMAFQIADDMLDYAGTSESMGKNAGDDFKEGKMSAPVIYALQQFNADQRHQFLTHFGKGNIESALLSQSLNLIRTTNALQNCHTQAQDHITRAKASLSTLQHSDMKAILCDVADYVLTRNN